MRVANRMLKELGLKIARKREKAALTQMKVARLAGYNSSQPISNIERGLSMPDHATLAKLCLIIGMDPDELRQVLHDGLDDQIDQAFRDARGKK